MSDEHKPHGDDHGHGHDHEAAKPADDHAPTPAHDAPDAHAAETQPVDDHGHADDHSVAAEIADGHESHAGEDTAHDAPADAHHAETGAHDEPAVHHDATADEPAAHDAPAHDDHAPVAPVAAAAAVGAAAGAASTAERRPVWSDEGDAPFEDTVSTPVYARGKGKTSKGKSSGGSAGSETVEIIKTVFFALLIAMLLRVLLFQPFTIPSASMEPNLYEGDYIVVSKWSYGYSKHSIPFSPPLFDGRILERTPERGDIVVFKLPRDNRTDYIKRLIGLPGDQVQMINNRLHINGRAVDDVVVSQGQIEDIFGARPVTRLTETLPGGRSFTIQDFGPGGDLDDTPVYVVPAGHYFMMGDNRDNSIDSRVEQSAGVGLVPAENLVGKAEIILFSWSPGASLFNPVSWFANIRPSRFFTVLN